MYRSALPHHLMERHFQGTQTGVMQQFAEAQRQQDVIDSMYSEFVCGNHNEDHLPPQCLVFNFSTSARTGQYYSPFGTFSSGEKIRCVFRDSLHPDFYRGWFGGVVSDHADALRFKMEMSILDKHNHVMKTFARFGHDQEHGHLHRFNLPGNDACGQDFTLTNSETWRAVRTGATCFRVRCRITLLPDLLDDSDEGSDQGDVREPSQHPPGFVVA
jgi:hypothetical protein